VSEATSVERISPEQHLELQKQRRLTERLQLELQLQSATQQRLTAEAQALMQEGAAKLGLYLLDLADEYKVYPPDGIDPNSGIIRRQS